MSALPGASSAKSRTATPKKRNNSAAADAQVHSTGSTVGDSLATDDPYSSLFQPSRLTVPQLRSLLLAHAVYAPSSARKPALVQLYEDEIRANVDELRAARNRDRNVRPDARGITYMSGSPIAGAASADQTIDSSENDNQSAILSDDGDASLGGHASDASDGGRRPRSALSRGSTPRSRRSVSWADSVPSSDEDMALEADTSNFSLVNPFQSPGPVAPEGARPKQQGARKSEPAFRSASPSSEAPQLHSGKAARHSVGAPARKRSSLAPRKSEAGDETHATVKRNAKPRRSRSGTRKQSDASDGDEEQEESASDGGLRQAIAQLLWTALCAFALAYYIWFVNDSKTIGFCDVGRSSNVLLDRRRAEQRINSESTEQDTLRILPQQLPHAMRPSCTPCPAHALCEDGHLAACESSDYIMRLPLLSYVPLVSSAVPLSYVAASCDPDEEKVTLAADLADEIESMLRRWKGDVLCERKKAKFTAPAKNGGRSPTVTALPTREVYNALQASAERGSVLRGHEDGFFQELWDLAIEDLAVSDRVALLGDSMVAQRSALGVGVACRTRRAVGGLWRRLRLALAGVCVMLVAVQWLRLRWRNRSKVQERAQGLVDLALGKLQRAKQRSNALGSSGSGSGEEPYLSIAQLRDTVLRHETSEPTRRELWARVSRLVEANTNVRTRQAKVQGEWARVWEWVGVLDEWGPVGGSHSPSMSFHASPNASQQGVGSGSGSGGWNVLPRADHNGEWRQANGSSHAAGDDSALSSAAAAEHHSEYNTGPERKTSVVV